MAKLSAYYSLCPLIDQKSLLGVAEDSTSNCVIVTLGRNIVIRYKLLNQKQISSWSSKEKLSSPVIYDELRKQYVAVFNRNQLRTWSESEENLDKIKKFKFHEQIHCVLPQLNGHEPLIVFTNGATCFLNTALESRKTQIDSNSLLTANEVIEDCQLVTYETCTYITFFSHSSSTAYFHVVPVSKDVSPVKLKIERENLNLMGRTTIQQDNSYNLLTLWSDGGLFSLTFLPEVCNKVPGNLVNVVRAVSTKHPVAMTNLSSNHVAIYGADPSEEGASLIIYNVQFGVVQSRLHLKLFASPPRLWCTGNNLLITTAHNLVVVPYRLETQSLSSLVGAHCSSVSKMQKNSDLQEVCHVKVNWMTNGVSNQSQSETEDVPQTLRQQLQSLQADGYPQSMVLQKLLPSLLESKSVTEMNWCLKYFTDIPESSLVQMLLLCLENDIDSNDKEQYSELLVAVLQTTFSDVCLLPYLRGIPFSQALTLLRYLCDELEEGSKVELSCVIDWICLMLDAHYQRLVLSGDPQVIAFLCRLRDLVGEEMAHISELKKLQPLLQQFKEGKLSKKKPHFANKLYSIELLRLY